VAAGVAPKIGHRSAQPEAIRTFVANGYGYTIVNARPRIDQALDGRRVVTIPIEGDPRAMVLGLARLASARQTRVVLGFVEHCREAIAAALVPGVEAQ
jgi:DNA-binding transcriptional LysR family regulator